MPPNTTFSAAASSDAPKVSLYEATTRSDVTAAQKAPQLKVKVFRNTADNGISTINARYSSVKPSDRWKPGMTRNAVLLEVVLATGMALSLLLIQLRSNNNCT